MKRIIFAVAIIAIALAIAISTTVYATPVNFTIDVVNAPYSVDGKSVDIFVASSLSHAATLTINGTSVNASLEPNTYIAKADFGNFSLIYVFTVENTTTSVTINFSELGSVEYNVTGYDNPIVYSARINYSTEYSGELVYSTADKLYFNKPIKLDFPEKIGGPLVYYKLTDLKLDGNDVNDTSISISSGAHKVELVYTQTYITSEIDPIYIIGLIVGIAVVTAVYIYYKRGRRYESIIYTYNSKYIE